MKIEIRPNQWEILHNGKFIGIAYFGGLKDKKIYVLNKYESSDYLNPDGYWIYDSTHQKFHGFNNLEEVKQALDKYYEN